MSKSTLSFWFSKKDWSKKTRINLRESQREKNKDRLILANRARQERKHDRHRIFIKEACLEYNELKKDLLFLVGLGIYWGEGDKANFSRVAVINTDPELLSIAVTFFLKCLKIPPNNLRVGLFIYEDINKDDAIEFWSQKLTIPKNQFIKVQCLKSRSKLTRRKSSHGVCSLYFCSTKINIKIKQWFKLIYSEICGNSSAVE